MCFAKKVTVTIIISTSQAERDVEHKDVVSQAADTNTVRQRTRFLIPGFWPLAPREIYVSAASLETSSHQRSTETWLLTHLRKPVLLHRLAMVSVPTTESLDFLGQASAKCTTVVKSENAWIRGSKSSYIRKECTVRLQYVLKRTCLNRS